MKISYITFIFFFLITIKTIFHFQLVNTNKKIIKLEEIKAKKIEELELFNINWTFIKRPENLNKINEQNFNFKPIVIEDELKLKDF
ncbi:MAG: hypothetical protein CMM91_08880 [Rickettsiales bacterium]|nr:hypothetical protein [Rickettsiales bacterium]OUV53154.1 MAG: hypothetical protein CBC87_04595 [Rickettsiales bacterium TMED127]|tara:strand:+ start:3090 stop:3347 length:258 start_codon:yes stop_codon:yes gene_type:complete